MNARSNRAPAVLGTALVLSLVLSACASATRDEPSEVAQLVSHGRCEEAVELAARLHRERPDDAAAAEAWRLASVALLLENGRKLSFQDRDLEALATFDEAAELGPDVPQIEHWREATLDKLADQWISKGFEFHNSDNLQEASNCYEKALEYRPDDLRAKSGLARVLVQLNYRRGMGEQYYQEGIQAFEESWLDQASHHFSATQKYDRRNERASYHRTKTDTLRADARVAQALELEELGNFAGARNEFRLATLFDPQHAEALQGLERTKKEEQAAEALRECIRKTTRREFDAAQALLEKGLALTTQQQVAFDSARDELVNARLMVKYESARALEVDHRYEDAIVAYAELIAQSPQGFFQDALARKDSLEDNVRRAGEYYAQAMAASDPAEKLRLVKQVLVVYPEYKDAIQIQAELESKLPPPSDQPPR